jgi:GT2 family glycosyltransferase
MKAIYILIPVHNRIDTTKRGLLLLNEAISLYDERRSDLKISIVIIDDGSTDGTAEWIQEYLPEVMIVKGDGNLWWSGSINKGIEYVRANKQSIFGYLLWNDDLKPSLDYFIELDNIFNSGTDSLIFGSILLEMNDPDKVHGYGAVYNKYNGLKRYLFRGCETSEIEENKIKSDWLPGMGTFLSDEVINKTGFFNNNDFPQYFGDIDYTLRASNACKTQIYVYKSLKVYNDIETTGLNKITKFKDLYVLLTSNRSKYQLVQNFKFYLKHGYFPLTMIGFFVYYIKLFVKFVNSKNS